MPDTQDKQPFAYRVGLVRMDPEPFVAAGAVCMVESKTQMARAFTGTQDNLPSVMLAALMRVESMLPGCTAGEADVAPGEFSILESYVAILDEAGRPWVIFGAGDDSQAHNDAKTVLSHPNFTLSLEIIRLRTWVNGTGGRPWADRCRELVTQ